LLIGAPGNGKTSLAEAIAYELAIPLFTVRYEGVIASYLGETAARVARLFDYARTRRCVLFFDEFDAIAKERGDPHDTGEVKRVVSSLLLQVDNLPSHVVVIAATNHSNLLDSAVWRRFQIRLTLNRPTFAQRRQILDRLVTFFDSGRRISVDAIARRLPGTSFSDLVEFVTDVERKYVLGLPDLKPDAAIKAALDEWALRTGPTEPSNLPDNGR
jgi:SpoVK/Ycf46/Vps4 family AAA+-type ATPase